MSAGLAYRIKAWDSTEFKNRGVDLGKDEHEHDGCDCGCEGEEIEILMLVDDDGEEHPFELIAELEIEDKTYVVVAPLDDEEEDEEEAEILILRATYDDEGNISYLADIEDDEEWEMVADAWQELVESEEVQ